MSILSNYKSMNFNVSTVRFDAADWVDFERKCYEYLQDNYGKLNGSVRFVWEGNSVSTRSDILVEGEQGSFYVEVKSPEAQSGQFVLFPDTVNSEFVFSPQNKSVKNEFVDAIMEHMNTEFDAYANAGKDGRNINLDPEIFYEWVTNYYMSKNVRFIMSSFEGRPVIVPVDKLRDYFDTSATYRIKKSGSSKPAEKSQKPLLQLIQEKFDAPGFVDGKKLFVTSDEDLHEQKFMYEDYEYQFSKRKERGANIYEVRRLSNTHNMNVIFKLVSKAGQRAADLKAFEKAIQSL